MGDSVRSGAPARRTSLAEPPAAAPRPAGTPATPRIPKKRPDPRPMRLALGVGGLAALSAMASAIIVGPGPAGATSVTIQATTLIDPPVAVQHVKVVVQLKPGQTAPPQSIVTQLPAPTPRIVVVTTKQSGIVP